MDKPFRGYFGILMTPFDESGDLLWDDLQRECDWAVRAGVHGLIWPVNDSEYTSISFPERVQGMQLVVETVAGRVPVMLGVADTSKAGAVALAREAQRVGADSVIAMPPWQIKLGSRDLIEDYYRAIAAAAEVPVCIQNLDPPIGSGLSGELVVDLCRKIPLVEYVKEERLPHGARVNEIIALAGPEVKGVFTGGTLLGWFSTHRRGAAGNMAATYVPDVEAGIWDLLEAGDDEQARRAQNALAVLEQVVRGTHMGVARKEVLVRRGVFHCNAIRNVGLVKLDKQYLAELDYALSLVEPYFRV